jgi:hypothetical protein
MLIAYIKKKNRTQLPSSFEDEITSTVFDPLKFMSSGDAWGAICEAGLIEQSVVSDDAVLTSHSVDFWRSFSNPAGLGTDGWHNEEPDVLFMFKFENGLEIWLILEVKWNSVANNTQLAHQWIAVTQSEQALLVRRMGSLTVKHTYLTLNFSVAWDGIQETNGCAAKNFNSNEWAMNALPLSWSQLKANLDDRVRIGNSSQVRCWAESASKFLQIMNVLPFRYFRGVDPLNKVNNYTFQLRPKQISWPTIGQVYPFCLRQDYQ